MNTDNGHVTTASKTIAVHFKAVIQTMLDDDDGNARLFDQIQQIALIAYDTVKKLDRASDPVLASLSALPSAINSSGYSIQQAYSGFGFNGAETFGARIVREVIASLPELLRMKNETPSALVTAIAAAKDAGLDDVADALRTKLIGSASTTLLHDAADNAADQGGMQ